jgi:hypothetical protein
LAAADPAAAGLVEAAAALVAGLAEAEAAGLDDAADPALDDTGAAVDPQAASPRLKAAPNTRLNFFKRFTSVLSSNRA